MAGAKTQCIAFMLYDMVPEVISEITHYEDMNLALYDLATLGKVGCPTSGRTKSLVGQNHLRCQLRYRTWCLVRGSNPTNFPITKRAHRHRCFRGWGVVGQSKPPLENSQFSVQNLYTNYA